VAAVSAEDPAHGTLDAASLATPMEGILIKPGTKRLPGIASAGCL
jgi:hypothetical protein